MNKKQKIIFGVVCVLIICIAMASLKIDYNKNDETRNSELTTTPTAVVPTIKTTGATTTTSTTTTAATVKTSTTKGKSISTKKTTEETTTKEKGDKSNKKDKDKKRNKKGNKSKLISLGTFRLTAYCNGSCCCGQWAGGATASGTMPKAGRTIAVDTSVIPFGTKVVINGHTYVAEDTGSAIRGNRIDIYFDSHQSAMNFGVQYIEVFKMTS